MVLEHDLLPCEPCDVDAGKLSQLRVFSGRAHPELARSISELIGVPLSPTETIRFSNDNLFVQLQDNVREKDVYLIQPLSPPTSEHLVELFLMCDAARGAGARRITAVIPHFSYARSDRKDKPRISIAARLMADLIAAAGAMHVMTMSLHSPQVHGFFGIPTDHLADRYVFAPFLQRLDLSNSVMVSPDMGRAKETSKLARMLGLPMAAANKERLTDSEVETREMIGKVAGRDAIVYDDEIATGGTIVETCRLLEERGARSTTIVCGHGLFTGPAIERLAPLNLRQIVTTDTVPIPPEKRLPNMVVLSVAPIFAEAIRRNLQGESLQPLFSY